MPTTKKSNVLNRVISKRLINFAEKQEACRSALEWLRVAPHAWDELYARDPEWFIWGLTKLLVHGTKAMKAEALAVAEAKWEWPENANRWLEHGWRGGSYQHYLLIWLETEDTIYWSDLSNCVIRPNKERRQMVLRLLGYDV